MKELERFKEVFWEGFYKPKLKSEKFRQLWESLDSINNWLSGPFFAIYENGNCDYFLNDKIRFPNINNVDNFFDWCIELIENYKNGIIAIKPDNNDESSDMEALLYQTDIKMELADLAYQIQKERSVLK